MIAANRPGAKELLLRLIERKADLNAQNRQGKTALMYGAKRPNIESTLALLEAGAKIDIADNNKNTALHIAARNGFKRILEVLISYKADVNVQNNDGETPIMLAKNVELARILVESGALLTPKNKRGQTALGVAKYYRRQEIIDYLEKISE